MKNRTKLGYFIKKTWTNINIRAGKYRHLGNSHKNKCYSNISVEFTREEYKEYCLRNKELILSMNKPSIDRIDSSKNYSINNIRIIELEDNIRIKSPGNKYSINKNRVKRGVSLVGKKYHAKIRLNGKMIYLGSYEDKEEAYNSFKEAYIKHYNRNPW